jgi:hypothetical protein
MAVKLSNFANWNLGAVYLSVGFNNWPSGISGIYYPTIYIYKKQKLTIFQ